MELFGTYTYIRKLHFFSVIHAVYGETALVDESVKGRVRLNKEFV